MLLCHPADGAQHERGRDARPQVQAHLADEWLLHGQPSGAGRAVGGRLRLDLTRALRRHAISGCGTSAIYSDSLPPLPCAVMGSDQCTALFKILKRKFAISRGRCRCDRYGFIVSACVRMLLHRATSGPGRCTVVSIANDPLHARTPQIHDSNINYKVCIIRTGCQRTSPAHAPV